MGRLTLTLPEICRLIESRLAANGRVQVVAVEPEGTAIRIRFKASIFPTATLYLQFKEFRNGLLQFHVYGNKFIDTLLRFARSAPIPHLQIDRDRIALDLEALLIQKLPTLKIKEIVQQASGDFTVELDLGDLSI